MKEFAKWTFSTLVVLLIVGALCESYRLIMPANPLALHRYVWIRLTAILLCLSAVEVSTSLAGMIKPGGGTRVLITSPSVGQTLAG